MKHRCEFDAALGGSMAMQRCKKSAEFLVTTRGYSLQPSTLCCADHYRCYKGSYITSSLKLPESLVSCGESFEFTLEGLLEFLKTKPRAACLVNELVRMIKQSETLQQIHKISAL